ncbi:MAG: hypothetical protein ABIV50_15345 [Opitutus sp.]
MRNALMILMSVVATLLASNLHAAKSDIAGLAARRVVLESASSLTATPAIAPLPSQLNHPFNPVAFGRPDAEELAAIAAAQAAEAAALNKIKPATEADLLERIAERVIPSGTLTLNGEPLLIFAQKRLRVGDRITVTYEGKDYNLELSSIQRFTFTLRLNRAEITRRINPGKNP